MDVNKNSRTNFSRSRKEPSIERARQGLHHRGEGYEISPKRVLKLKPQYMCIGS